MIQSRVLYGWEFSFSGRPDFWNGITGYDYSIRFIDVRNNVKEAHFKDIVKIMEFVREENIEFGKLKREIIPPCSIALKNYIYLYFDHEVVLKYRRPVSKIWKSQYDAVDRGKRKIG